ncbi:hypothetical protein [Chryseolinea sp. H1M3-3]|uniref:hypothetical protein n=1 Tax=Chryseolinea sp. H1M3-3 TaxID=3034144 RepID=UPI0023EAC3ED|nr:hypothetical protein [Chryseolinea sp. H1M3-3]
MKKFICLAGCMLLSAYALMAQEEGVIEKRSRIDRNKGIFIGLGPSFTLGKNIGDYSVGFNVEAGFQKRLNRVLSIGPSISYMYFQYDPEITTEEGGAYVGYGDPNNWRTTFTGVPNLNYDYGYVLNLEGGDLSLLSLAVNLKFNFVPIRDNSKISVYGFAKPFVTLAMRKEVNGSAVRYAYETYVDDQNTAQTNDDILYYNQGDDTWYPDGTSSTWGPDDYDALKSDTEITGGIFIGPGIEISPAKAVSFYVQAAFGYTFPITYVATRSYEPTVDSYFDEEFPMVKKGFPSVNLQFGVSFNF